MEQLKPGRSKLSTVQQVSAGGVAFRPGAATVEIVIISVGTQLRWQLPKGIVDSGETPEITAVREVREEAGIQTKLIQPIDVIEYWYIGDLEGQRVRFHKFVHFFLLAYQSGNVQDHDHEVHEAQWVSVEQALELLAFKGEKQVVQQAQLMIVSEPTL
ncbi:MAG: NUDIX domain-containing protein [Leptolyngbyaceae cyanobacterium SL_5_9]|nr:NUDIX domain-containing protein [Leptolyngbyaceae cyanobacterium SL_5_9]NJO75371.1 NUDIX domain-containing protein [Leptolyngbyaceae cyanobacterium RM1_406_9]